MTPEERARALRDLEATPRVVEWLLALADGGAATRRDGPFEWSPHEILGHLWDLEGVVNERLKAFERENGAYLPGWDEREAAARGRYGEQPVAELLAGFRARRERTVAHFRALADRDWERWAEHAELGRITLDDQLRILAAHDRNHLGRIAILCAPR